MCVCVYNTHLYITDVCVTLRNTYIYGQGGEMGFEYSPDAYVKDVSKYIALDFCARRVWLILARIYIYFGWVIVCFGETREDSPVSKLRCYIGI